ncbi:MAG: sialidase, partial [Acidobacteriota bacterium]|nr:sialidase [Acidobacteriota bacterium]
RWWKCNNLPVSQFYHVSVDEKEPYQVYGGLQDNSSWAGDSSYPGGITNGRWENLFGGDGFWVFVDPADPNFVYAEAQGGFIGRIDRKNLAARDIQPKALYKEKLRWNWNAPIHLSRLEKGKLYLGAQFLFVTKDGGQSWQRISPDLTTNDPEKQKQEQSGGITVDNSAAEMHTTIYSISESPRDGKTIWVGTDDGNLQLTRDGGAVWTNLVKNVPGLPPASWVSWIEAGPHADGAAYAAFDRHTFGDLSPWVYATKDFGKTWERIAGPSSGVRGWAYVIKEDPVREGLLYLGTEFGLWISGDAGKTWREFKGGNFPSVSVRDLAFQTRDQDLVVATHGRGIWIVDDLTPLRALTQDVLAKDVAFLPGRPVVQKARGQGGWPEGDASYTGPNPPAGADISYFQKTRHTFGRMRLEVLDASGRVVDTLPAGKRKGINRVMWSMQEKPPRVPTAAQTGGASSGPRVLPGTYTVRLTKGKDVVETPLVVSLDPKAPFTLADRKAQYDAAMHAHALFGRMSEAVDRLNRQRAVAAERAKGLPAGDAVRKDLDAFAAKADAIRKDVVATSEGGAITGEERLREHLAYVYDALLSYEGRPGDYQVERVAVLERELKDVEARATELAVRDLSALNKTLREKKVAPIE